MLVSKSLPPNTVVTTKLASGEEIVGVLVSYDEKKLVLRKPVALLPQMTEGGRANVIMLPISAAASEEEFTFSSALLVFDPVKVKDEVKNPYIKATTGIEVAPVGGSIIV